MAAPAVKRRVGGNGRLGDWSSEGMGAIVWLTAYTFTPPT